MVTFDGDDMKSRCSHLMKVFKKCSLKHQKPCIYRTTECLQMMVTKIITKMIMMMTMITMMIMVVFLSICLFKTHTGKAIAPWEIGQFEIDDWDDDDCDEDDDDDDDDPPLRTL